MVWAVLIEQLVCQIFPFYFREEQETLPTFGNLTEGTLFGRLRFLMFGQKNGQDENPPKMPFFCWKFGQNILGYKRSQESSVRYRTCTSSVRHDTELNISRVCIQLRKILFNCVRR